jgi:ribosomal protein S18 acetylase RimI-like enzyme
MDVLSRRDLLERTGNHPYVTMMAADSAATVWQRGEAYVWLADGPWGPVIASLGSADDVLPLLADLRAAGSLAWTTWTHLPRVSATAIAEYVTATMQDDWDFLWTRTAPLGIPQEGRVERLGDRDAEAISAVLADAMPDSSTRPGDSRVRGWYGIREGDDLVAVAADRSRNDTGFLAAIAVRRTHQGRGFGAAVTSALTRSLLDEYAAVALGVMWDNSSAQRLYERLGYTNRIERTSVRLS